MILRLIKSFPMICRDAIDSVRPSHLTTSGHPIDSVRPLRPSTSGHAIHCTHLSRPTIRRGGGWVDVGRGRLRRPPSPLACMFHHHTGASGRRKRSRPSQPLPPPLQNGRNNFLLVASILLGLLTLLITSCGTQQ